MLRLTPLTYFGQRENIFEDLKHLMAKKKFRVFYDLCSGSGSITFAAMQGELAEEFYINDSFHVFKNLWELIKTDPNRVIRQYSEWSEAYVKLSPDDRLGFFNKLLKEFNEKNISADHKQEAAILFAFLINHTKNSTPLFNDIHELTSGPAVEVTAENIQKDVVEFRERVIKLSALLKSKKVTATSGDFCSHLAGATDKDVVVLDPPYPEQSRDVYFNINTERKLYDNLCTSLKNLASKNVPVVMCYGANKVLLRDQFRDEALNLQHLIRLSSHPLFGDFLEHIYVSKNLYSSLLSLPPNTVPYEKLFKVDAEMTEDGCKKALATLKMSQEFSKTTYRPGRLSPTERKSEEKLKETLVARPV